jgi:hypothetical protein
MEEAGGERSRRMGGGEWRSRREEEEEERGTRNEERGTTGGLRSRNMGGVGVGGSRRRRTGQEQEHNHMKKQSNPLDLHVLRKTMYHSNANRERLRKSCRRCLATTHDFTQNTENQRKYSKPGATTLRRVCDAFRGDAFHHF